MRLKGDILREIQLHLHIAALLYSMLFDFGWHAALVRMTIISSPSVRNVAEYV